MKKMILGFIVFLLLLSARVVFYVYREMGDAPTAEELKVFEKLPYFRNGRFQNPEPRAAAWSGDYEDKADLLKLLLTDSRAPKKKLPQVELSKTSFAEKPGDNVVYWLGHAATIVELNGKRIGIDLVFGNASPVPLTVRRFQKAPLKRSELPELDYILLTHNHYDHLERKTVQSIEKGHFIVPYGVKTTLRGWGISEDRISEIGWGESFEAEGLKFTAVEGMHFAGRSLTDGNRSLWNSYVIQTPQRRVFWGGDSGYGRHFAAVGKKFGPFDWAALEIDAWNGGWPGIHMFPEQVVAAAEDLQAKRLLPIHWGAYNLGWHMWNKSINRVVNNAKSKPFELMTPQMGEKLIPGETQTREWWKSAE